MAFLVPKPQLNRSRERVSFRPPFSGFVLIFFWIRNYFDTIAEQIFDKFVRFSLRQTFLMRFCSLLEQSLAGPIFAKVIYF